MIDGFSDMIPFYSFLYIPIAILVIFSIKKYHGDKFFSSKREKVCSLLYGFCFVFLYTTGAVLASGGTLHHNSGCYVLASSLLFSAIIGIGYHEFHFFFEKQFSDAYTERYALQKHPMFLSACVMMICWLPIFFALYPGIFAYDVEGQILQTMHGYSTQQPLLHTFYLKIFYDFVGDALGSKNRGIAISIIIQMCFFAASLSYVIQYMVGKKLKKSIVVAVLAYFSVIPIFPIMAVSMTKDIFFTASFHATFIQFLKLKDENYEFSEKSDWGLLVFFLVMTGLLRNNGRYVVYIVVIAILLKAFVEQSNVKKLCVIGLASVALLVFCGNTLRVVTHSDRGSKNEMMSVPYQQLGRVYKYDYGLLPENDRKTLELLLPEIADYHASLSDYIKNNAKVFSNAESQKKFWRMYVKYMKQSPIRYTEAFLMTTMGYWFLDDTSSSQVYSPWPIAGIFEVNFTGVFGVTHETMLPALDEALKKLFHENQYQKIPIIAVVFNMGTYLWLIVACVFLCVQKKKVNTIIPLSFLLAYISTLFAGPCALFRYALPYIVCIPALMVMTYPQETKQIGSE